MANNHIRSEMAARHAAWYKGTTGNDMTSEQLDQWFFYQTNVAKVSYQQGERGETLGSLLGIAMAFLKDEDGYPTKATVVFGPSDASQATQFPFNMLNTQVPLMPNSMLTNWLSVSAECQWDHVGETWNEHGAVFQKVWDGITQGIPDIIKKILPD